MPIYQYIFEDGSVEERLFKAKDRPQTITRDDGEIGVFIIAPVARLERNWSAFAKYGTGKYNKTLKKWITSDKEHDKLCEQKGLHRINQTDFDRITRQKEKDDEGIAKTEKEIKTYQRHLEETKDPNRAYDLTYGEEDMKVAKQATNKIFEKYPQAKYINWDQVKGAK